MPDRSYDPADIGELKYREGEDFKDALTRTQAEVRPWCKHPDETDESYERRRKVFEKTGVWPRYGEDTSSDSYRRFVRAKEMTAEARLMRQKYLEQRADMDHAIEAGRNALKEIGIEDPDEAGIPNIAAALARQALVIAAGRLSELDSGRLVNVAQRSVQVAQLLTGQPTHTVGVLSGERARKLLEIAQKLREMDAMGVSEAPEDIEAELSITDENA